MGWLLDAFSWTSQNIIRPTVNAIFGNFFNNLQEGAKAAREAEDAADAAAEAARLAEDRKAQSYSQAMRQADIDAVERRIEAEAVNDQSRAAAISAYQQESQGEAALAGSGIAGGSPYMAFEASVGETERGIRSWWNRADAGMDLSEMRSVGYQESARYGQRESDYNISLLHKQAANYQEQADEMTQAFSPMNLILGGAGALINGALSMYSLSSTIGAAGKMLKANGGIGGLGQLLTADGGQVMDYMAEVQTAQALGLDAPEFNPTQASGLFQEGGLMAGMRNLFKAPALAMDAGGDYAGYDSWLTDRLVASGNKGFDSTLPMLGGKRLPSRVFKPEIPKQDDNPLRNLVWGW